MTYKTLNQILTDAGIKTIRPENKKHAIFLEYGNKRIIRPNPDVCYDEVLKHFLIDLKEFE
jgi:hypothetical protein